ncbi:MAG TPA: hypothetical protein V6C46_04725, partial [Coleofasciculaceae cyanobacterium]
MTASTKRSAIANIPDSLAISSVFNGLDIILVNQGTQRFDMVSVKNNLLPWLSSQSTLLTDVVISLENRFSPLFIQGIRTYRVPYLCFAALPKRIICSSKR